MKGARALHQHGLDVPRSTLLVMPHSTLPHPEPVEGRTADVQPSSSSSAMEEKLVYVRCISIVRPSTGRFAPAQDEGRKRCISMLMQYSIFPHPELTREARLSKDARKELQHLLPISPARCG
jgi:hypothetical protein